MEYLRVVETGEGIERAILKGLPRHRWGRDGVSGGHPALLVVSPGAAAEGLALPAACRTILLPGDTCGLPEGLRAASAVSYGTSPRNSLTLSSRRGERLWAALQRELVTVDGQVVERQEFSVPMLRDQGELAALAVAGALLLLGVPPEELDRREQ